MGQKLTESFLHKTFMLQDKPLEKAQGFQNLNSTHFVPLVYSTTSTVTLLLKKRFTWNSQCRFYSMGQKLSIHMNTWKWFKGEV